MASPTRSTRHARIYGLAYSYYFFICCYYLLLTAHYSLLTTDYLLLTTHYSLLTAHYVGAIALQLGRQLGKVAQGQAEHLTK